MKPRYSKPAIIFAATQRSGSTMVVDDFQNLTGRRRTESEAFYRLVLAAGTPAKDWDDAVARVEKHRENELVFFDKIMFHQLPQLSRMIDEERHSPMCHPFYDYFQDATWVYIRRSNVFEQVVSKYIAEHMNIWDKKDAKSENFNSRIRFDVDEAKIHLKALLKEDQNWQKFFRKHGIKPIEIFYEDAVSNFPDYLAPIFEDIGESADFSKVPERRMQKLGNQRNATLANVLMQTMMRETMLNMFEQRQEKRQAAMAELEAKSEQA